MAGAGQRPGPAVPRTLDIRHPVPGLPVFSGLLRYTVIATGLLTGAGPAGWARHRRAPRRRLGSDAVPIYALDYAAPSIDPQAHVHPDAVVIGSVELAAGASVWPGAVLRGDHGVIRVGERTSIQDGTVVHTTEEWSTLIGADCVVGHRAHLEGCVVEDGCLIGSGSLVLNRARVAAGAVVAAAALVREDMVVPAGALALGVPAGSAKRPARPSRNGSSTRCRPTWTSRSGTGAGCAAWTPRRRATENAGGGTGPAAGPGQRRDRASRYAARTARRLCAARRAVRAAIHHAPQVGRGTPLDVPSAVLVPAAGRFFPAFLSGRPAVPGSARPGCPRRTPAATAGPGARHPG